MYQNETIAGTLPYPYCIFAERSNRKYRNEFRGLLLYSCFYFERAEYNRQCKYESEEKIDGVFDVHDAHEKYDAYHGGLVHTLSFH